MRATVWLGYAGEIYALEPEENRYRFPSVRGHGPLLQPNVGGRHAGDPPPTPLPPIIVRRAELPPFHYRLPPPNRDHG